MEKHSLPGWTVIHKVSFCVQNTTEHQKIETYNYIVNIVKV